MSNSIVVFQPPKDIYSKKTLDKSQDVMREKKTTMLVSKVEYPEGGGIFLHYQGAIFPKKGWTTPEPVWAINVVKKIVLEYVKATPPWVLPFINKKKLVHAITMIGIKVLDSFFLEEKFQMAPAKEINIFMANFCENLGIDGAYFGKIASCVIEYDDAYCNRLQDMASETSKEALCRNPRKELSRLYKLWISRENLSVSTKLYFVKYIPYILIGKYKKAFFYALNKSDFGKFQYTEADRYHCMMRGDYECFGESLSTREARYIDMHYAAGVAPVVYNLKHE